MIENPEQSLRAWAKETTDRQGRERDLEEYEGFLGFRREELAGKTILDIGSGETELFSRGLQEHVPSANMISVNPDYSIKRFRKTIGETSHWQKKSVAAIGQELPFNDASFDVVLALKSVADFSSPEANPVAAQSWMREIVRVLKPGGVARIAPILSEADQEVWESAYRPLFDELQSQGVSVRVEMIIARELGLEEGEDTYHRRIVLFKPALKY
ncbi:MAG: hypothetical protein A3H42_01280 [Deltaproteobacteria bacterium RIFCSPLOWO2_02_FULL_46_8]|nr:MAG: hypothetical protein A3H42_01280 [Deltaproteobacteria bacterium RIFCSPLOWO2_02_FULL_46_8]